nr:hypothetical protein RVX_1440 [Nitratidesulfovibrio sp. HK-II]
MRRQPAANICFRRFPPPACSVPSPRRHRHAMRNCPFLLSFS